MPFKVEIQTHMNNQELTIETCSQIIEMLQNSYKNIRFEMYNHFLAFKHLQKAMLIVAILALLYFLTDEIIFIYLMPISILTTLILAIISAEFLTTKVKKQLTQQIQLFKQKKERLLKEQ